MQLTIVTVCTEESTGYLNFRDSLKFQGYSDPNIVVLGMNQKWQGWSWRSSLYYQYFHSICRHRKRTTHKQYRKQYRKQIYCCVDANDLFFVNSPTQLLEGFRSYHTDLLVSAERNQSLKEPFVKEFFTAINRTGSPYQYPNAGCIIGTAERLRDLYYSIRSAENDQQTIIRQRMDGTLDYQLDYYCRVVANIPFMSNYSFNDYQLFYFESPSQYQSASQDTLAGINHNKDNNKDKILRSKLFADSRPAIIHFPGTIPTHYNRFLKEIYPTLRSRNYEDTFIKTRSYIQRYFWYCLPFLITLLIIIIAILVIYSRRH